ncbi:MAG: diaminopimelate decarboxylase [Chloroflexi bacterium]|nr:diaminopimelate decarboxylase [Chloroflexota bacterium]
MVFNASIRYVDDSLFIDGIAADSIAREVGTPAYVYSLKQVTENYRRLRAAFAPLDARIHYSVKANGSLALLQALGQAGAGFDCVSAGEIDRCLRAGAHAPDIVFAGVGKTREEIAYAVSCGIGWFNVENVAELSYINDIAADTGVDAVKVALRLNPQVSANTHPYMATGHGAAKFGLTADVIREVLSRQSDYSRLDFAGIHIHVGSQLGDTAATLAALDAALDVIAPHPRIRAVNLGGGLPVAYRLNEEQPSLASLVNELRPRLDGFEVLLEPGRALVADAGLLIAEVLYVKRQAGQVFYIIDASMAELLRPALYDAHHEVAPLRRGNDEAVIAQVVGPVCESADVLARDRLLPRLQAGDRVALMTAGAYGMSMASNYNARPRPAEVVVSEAGDSWRFSRRRETWENMHMDEVLVNWA